MSDVRRLPAYLLTRTRVLPSREDILGLLPKGRVFVEVGVAFGDFSAMIIEVCAPARLIAIDTFAFEAAIMIWGRPAGDRLGGRSHAEFYAERFAPEIDRGRLDMMTGDACEQLERLDEQSVDIIYLDAGHSSSEVAGQLSVARRKLKSDGLIVVNDYTFNDFNSEGPSFYGVIQATHDFMIDHDWEMIYLALHPQMFCDVVLQKRAPADCSGAQSDALPARSEI